MNKSKLFFSIIIPAYNVENYISNTLLSVIDQNYDYFEIILVNDGSTDRTEYLVKTILDRTIIKHSIISQINRGVSTARNIGLDNSSGEYVIFLDGDDTLEPDFLNSFNNELKDKKSDICFSRYRKIDESGNQISEHKKHACIKNNNDRNVVIKEFINSNDILWTGCVVYNRKLLKKYKIQFCKNLKYGEDQEFTFKALFYSKSVAFIDKVLVNYLQRSSGAVGSFNVYRVRDNLKACSKMKSLAKANNEPFLYDLLFKQKIPFTIYSLAKKFAIKGNFNEFKRITGKKTLKSYLCIGIYSKNMNVKLKLKLSFLLFFNQLFFKFYNKRQLVKE